MTQTFDMQNMGLTSLSDNEMLETDGGWWLYEVLKTVGETVITSWASDPTLALSYGDKNGQPLRGSKL
jgi:hypothetical protein